MTKRNYVSSVRASAAAETHERIIAAGAKLLRKDASVAIFCTFWSHDPAIGGLNQAVATDPEFGDSLIERNERRRELLTELLSRIVGKDAAKRAMQDAVDLIFVLTSYPTFAALSPQRSTADVRRLVQTACRAAVDGLTPDARGSAERKK